MSENIAVRMHRPLEGGRRRAHHLILGAVLGMVIGALGFAIVAATVKAVRPAMASASVAEAAAPLPDEAAARELPREWRQWEIGVDVEHMYRQTPSQRLDWIREGGRR